MRFSFLYYDKEDEDIDNSDGQRKKKLHDSKLTERENGSVFHFYIIYIHKMCVGRRRIEI